MIAYIASVGTEGAEDVGQVLGMAGGWWKWLTSSGGW